MKVLPQMAILYPGSPPMFADFWSGRANRVIVSSGSPFIRLARLEDDRVNDVAFPGDFQAGIVMNRLS